MTSRDRFLQSVELLGIAALELGLKLAPCGLLLPSWMGTDGDVGGVSWVPEALAWLGS